MSILQSTQTKATTKRLRQQPAVRRERLVAAAEGCVCAVCVLFPNTPAPNRKTHPAKKEGQKSPYPRRRRYFGTTKYGLSTPCTEAARRTDIRLHESRFATRSNDPSSAKTRRNTPASESSGISRHVLISAPPRSGHASAPHPDTVQRTPPRFHSLSP